MNRGKTVNHVDAVQNRSPRNSVNARSAAPARSGIGTGLDDGAIGMKGSTMCRKNDRTVAGSGGETGPRRLRSAVLPSPTSGLGAMRLPDARPGMTLCSMIRERAEDKSTSRRGREESQMGWN